MVIHFKILEIGEKLIQNQILLNSNCCSQMTSKNQEGNFVRIQIYSTQIVALK